MWLTSIFILFIFLFLLFRKYFDRNANYWKDRGIVTLRSETTLFELLSASKAPADADKFYYDQLGSQKFGGLFEFGNPMLFLKDLDIVKQILVKDFDKFMDHRDFVDTDPIFSKSLFFLHTSEWREMRAFLSPTFTSGKIRRMFHHFERCSTHMKEYVHKNCVPNGDGYEICVPELMGRFTTDVIGAVLHLACKQMHSPTRIQSFFKWLMQSLDKTTSDFFLGLLRKAFLEREANQNEGREDFMQILIEAKAENKTTVDFTMDLAVQQAFLFFIAGFDTVRGGLSTASYLLAMHPEVQEKLYGEVSDAMVNGTITYEAVNKLEYMDMVVLEILRMHPPVLRLERKCTQACNLHDGSFTVPKGMMVAIPVESIHYDPKYYKNPEQFLPERFSAENKANRNQYTYLPFGTGPRSCIGMRFALVEIKVALAYLIYNFEIFPLKGITPNPVKMLKQFGFTRVPKDLQLKIIPRR